MTNRWSFNNPAGNAPAGTALVDSVSGVTASVRGTGSIFKGDGLTLTGATTGNQTAANIAGYVDLPNGIFSSKTNLTLEIWAAPLSYKANSRIFDFGRITTAGSGGGAAGEIIDTTTVPGAGQAAYDAVYVNFCLTSLNTQRMKAWNNGVVMTQMDTTLATVAGTTYHYVFTFEDGVGTFGAAGGRMTWFRNGTQVTTADVNFRLANIEDVNNWLGRSNFTNDSLANANYNEFRLYNHVLTPAEISANLAAGPDTLPGPPVAAPVPDHRWTFTTQADPGAASGTVFEDEIGTQTATLRGNGGSLTGGAVVLPGTTNGNQTASTIAAYIDLPNGIVSETASVSFEAWATPISSKTWQRLFDFGRCVTTHGSGAVTGEILDAATAPGATAAYDNLSLTLNNAGNLNSQQLEGQYDGNPAVFTSTTAATTAGTKYHYVLVVQDTATGCEARWYRNGVLQNSDDFAFHLNDMEDVNNWIGRSMYSGDSNSNLSLDEFRIYRRAITLAEVNSSFIAGPDAVFLPPVAIADAATIHPGQKVLVDVLANDTGSPLPGSLEIVSPPATGTATISGGKILYAHAGSSATPVTFNYRVGNNSGSTATGTVTIHFAASLRLTNAALAMPDAPPSNTWQLVDALPGLTFAQPICIASIPGNSSRLFVCERVAKIKHIPDVTATTPVQNVFLNLQTAIAGRTPAETIEGGSNNEHGLLGLAFHPLYASNGYFYVAYTVRIGGGSYYQRISRFRVSTADPSVADPASELILLNQLDQGSNHDGGDLHFGPDGFLYYTAGDELAQRDTLANSQKINLDFFSGIFRIDVDKGAGSIEPNSHAAIPTDGGIARFSVPKTNPFVHTSLGGTWTGTYNGNTINPLGSVRSEFWCTGLRHVWRFSFDPANGDLWAGDVGQDTYEEINRIVKGGNYGWVYREGAHDTAFTNPVPPAKPPGFTSLDPFYEYVHAAVAGGDVNFKGNSVVGGNVYRGTRYSALFGTYIFSDSVSGHVWQMNTTTGATIRLTGLPGAYGVISTQGVDPANKDPLFAAYLTGKIMRLSPGSVVANGFPTTLSATGLFADLTDLSPAPGLLPYQPNLSFWSDHALKRRWFTIPDATSRMTWSKDGNWNYPARMLWVKHFDLELSRGNATTKKRIETRVLVKTDGGSYGVSYRWNEAQTDATLVDDAGVEFDLAIDDHGTPHTQRWQIPGRAGCITCHTPQGGHALSFNTRQLNLDNSIHGYTGNQLTLLSSNNFLTNTPDPVATLERHVRPDEDYPLEQRARSYFAVNCSYCHQTGGSVSGFWDGRAHLTLEQTGLIDGTAVNNGGSSLNRYVVPGRPDRSIVLSRMAGTNGFGRMPPLGSTETDPTDIQLVTDWITGARDLYAQWREDFFAANDPLGNKTADPDGDGVSNYDEYLRGSPPLTGSGSWQPSIADGKLRFLRKSHRYYSIQTSANLGQWQPWPVPEIEDSYQATDALKEIILPPAPDGRQFFRFNITEP